MEKWYCGGIAKLQFSQDELAQMEVFYQERVGEFLHSQDWALHMGSGRWLPLTSGDEGWEALA